MGWGKSMLGQTLRMMGARSVMSLDEVRGFNPLFVTLDEAPQAGLGRRTVAALHRAINRRKPHQGGHECRRRVRQIATGQITASNGLRPC